eukprot:225135_1
MNDIYKQFLDDQTHLIKHHGDQLQEIKNKLIQKHKCTDCKLLSCHSTFRHYRLPSQKETIYLKELDPMSNFYVEAMDSLHFYLFHCFDVGFRVNKTEEIVQFDTDNDDIKNKEFFDVEFARITRSISNTRDLTNSFARFSTKNTKFIITNINDTMMNEHKEEKNHQHVEAKTVPWFDNISSGLSFLETSKNATFLDKLYNHLLVDDVPDVEMIALQDFLNLESYDTESIKSDYDMNNGNISTYISNHKRCSFSLKHFVKSALIFSSSMSVGYRFYYWDYYKSIDELPGNECVIKDFRGNTADNSNEHSGEKNLQPFYHSKISDI